MLNPGVDLRSLPLTPEEGFVASRLDGVTDLHGLSVVTGLSPERVDAALEKLVSLGAVPPPPEETDEDGAESEEPGADEPAGVHRKLYETALRQLTAEERAARAKTAEETPCRPLSTRCSTTRVSACSTPASWRFTIALRRDSKPSLREPRLPGMGGCAEASCAIPSSRPACCGGCTATGDSSSSTSS